MEIRKVQEIRKYGLELELIPASHEGIFHGRPGMGSHPGSPEFSRKGMPNSIYTAFLDARTA